jgi:DNA-binding transcriptional MerR regulator
MQGPEPDTPLYAVSAFARRTGVPAVTLRAWERRYGFPRPTRTTSGRRLYTERDIWTVRAVRAQTTQGIAISRAIALLGDAPRLGPRSMASAEASPLERMRQDLLEALLALAAGRANGVLSDALSRVSIEDVCLGLMQPTLNEIGRRWQVGAASVAQEHFAAALLRARVSSMLAHASAATERPTIVAACPPGEWHELGVLMVCLFLARRQHAVAYLGANLPLDELERLTRQHTPRIVLLSAQTDATAVELREAARRLQRLPPPRPALAYGGFVFNIRPSMRAHVAGTFLGEDARGAVWTVERLLYKIP